MISPSRPRNREIERKARDILEHGDPLAFFVETAKRIEPDIDPKVFELLFVMFIATKCVENCTPDTFTLFSETRIRHPLESDVLDYLVGVTT